MSPLSIVAWPKEYKIINNSALVWQTWENCWPHSSNFTGFLMGRVELGKTKGSCRAQRETPVEDTGNLGTWESHGAERKCCARSPIHSKRLTASPSGEEQRYCQGEVRQWVFPVAGDKMGTCTPIVVKKGKAGATAEFWVWKEPHTQRKFPKERPRLMSPPSLLRALPHRSRR